MEIQNFSNQTSKSDEYEGKLSKLREVMNALEQNNVATPYMMESNVIPSNITPIIVPPPIPQSQQCTFDKSEFVQLQNNMEVLQSSNASVASIEKRLDEVFRALVAVSNVKSDKITEITPIKDSVERLENRLNEMGEAMNQLLANQEETQEKQDTPITQPKKSKRKKSFSMIGLILKSFLALICLLVIYVYVDVQKISPTEVDAIATPTKITPKTNSDISPAPTPHNFPISPPTSTGKSEKPELQKSPPAEILPKKPKVRSSLPKPLNLPDNFQPQSLRKAALADKNIALFEIGLRYFSGENIDQNKQKAASWFQRAAQKGLAPAQYAIAGLYEKGIGVAQNIKTATFWYEQAARQGNVSAMYELALIKAVGKEESRDLETALHWFYRSANLGLKDSQFNLGLLYHQGEGVPQSLVESYKWFSLAAQNGDVDAEKKRNEVAAAMSNADLDAGKNLIEKWQIKKPKPHANHTLVPKEWKLKSIDKKPNTNAPVNISISKNQISVRKVQSQLQTRGYDVGTPDGLLGPKTRQAIKDFQRSAGLPIDGKLNSNVLIMLNVKS